MTEEAELFQRLSDAVFEMEEDEVVSLSHQVVEQDYDAYEAIDKGLAAGMEHAGQLFEEQEYFVPELIICADAMYAGLEILKPHIALSDAGSSKTIVIGVIEGDTHDIGKNLVKIMSETSGFNVIDLGRDVPAEVFIEKAIELKADVIAVSTLMTTTMGGMADVINGLIERGIREQYKVIVGGGPISQAFADKIGADGYAVNATEAVRLVRRLLADYGGGV
jgi:corrinoid protein of di/trimethylamine methyltransferase